MEGQGKLRALLLLITSSFIYYTILSFVIPIIEDDIHPTSILLTIFPSKHVASKLAITQDTTCSMCYNHGNTYYNHGNMCYNDFDACYNHCNTYCKNVTCVIMVLTRAVTM